MKRFLITLIALQLAVVMGCAHTSSQEYSKVLLAARAKSEKVIKDLDTSAAPVLGPAFKEYLEALLEEDIEKAWGMMPLVGQEYFTALPEKHRKYDPSIMDRLEDAKKRLNAMKEANASDEQMIRLERDVAMMEILLQGNSGQDVLRAFAVQIWFSYRGGAEVVGEKIDGNKGRLTGKIHAPGDRDKISADFIKENGVWKPFLK